MKRQAPVFILLVFALVLLAACSGGQDAGEPDPVTDQGTWPGSPDVEIDSDAKLHPDFPLPVYEDWTVKASAKADLGDGVRWNATFQFTNDIEATSQRYAADLRGLGYEVSVMELGSNLQALVLTGTFDGKPADGRIGLSEIEGEKLINISIGYPLD